MGVQLDAMPETGTDVSKDAHSVAEALCVIEDSDTTFDIEVTCDDFDEDDETALENAVNRALGYYKAAYARDKKVITSGQYWELVDTYTEAYIEAQDHMSWADDLDDVETMLEIVMPSELVGGHYTPTASFWTLMHSHSADEAWGAWLTDMPYSDNDRKATHLSTRKFLESLEDDGWAEVLSDMAVIACIHDVATRVERYDDYEVDLGAFEA